MKRNKKTPPLVSVIIPVYNREKYIRECVESVLAQDYENLEIIVVDDGSTDATSEILKEFGERIIYIRQENKGPNAAINTGLRNSHGSFVSWLGSDDVYVSGFIKYLIRKFEEDASLSLVYTDYIIIDSEGKEIKVVNCPFPQPEQFPKRLLMDNFINGSAVMVRRTCHEKVGYYDENLKASGDADMWFRLLEYGYRFGHIPKPLVKYRWHQSNISHRFRLMQRYTDMAHVKALEAFSSRGFFTDPEEYEQLSYAFAKQYSFQAASIAMEKSNKQKFTLKRTFFWAVFNILNTDIFITLIGLMKRIGLIGRIGLMRRIWRKLTMLNTA